MLTTRRELLNSVALGIGAGAPCSRSIALSHEDESADRDPPGC